MLRFTFDNERSAEMASKAATWAERIGAWQRSGQSQAAYCRDHGLKSGTFSYWLRKRTVRAERKGGALVPVVVRGMGCSIDVVLPNGIRLQAPSAADPAHVQALAAALLRC
jgi:hypothetical protein